MVESTVTISVSYTQGPSGGLLPAAPTNLFRDFPVPGDYTAPAAKFNFTIIYVLASVFGVAIVFLLTEMGILFHWKRKIKTISKRCPANLIFQRRGDEYMCTGEQHTLSIVQYNGIPAGVQLSEEDYTALGNALAPGRQPKTVKFGGALRGILSWCWPNREASGDVIEMRSRSHQGSSNGSSLI